MPCPYIDPALIAALISILTAVLLGCTASPPEPAEAEYLFQGPTMGTVYRVKVVSADLTDKAKSRIDDAIRAQLDNVNAKMSTYEAESELSRFNRHRTTEPFPFSEDVLMVLAEARRISEITGGAFDTTVGPLVNAWGFGPSTPDALPTEPQLAELRQSVGWERIEIDQSASSARKRHPATQVDLSAIAKGYAVDRVSEALSTLGHTDHMVEVGGEVRTAGHNASGETWRIAVETPVAGSAGRQRIVPLRDAAMATSGDYRNFIERDGARYSHTIDPRTGRPVTHRLASASVIHDSCMTADAYATALMVMGEDEAFRFSSEHDLAVLLLIREDDGGFIERASPAFEVLRRP